MLEAINKVVYTQGHKFLPLLFLLIALIAKDIVNIFFIIALSFYLSYDVITRYDIKKPD